MIDALKKRHSTRNFSPLQNPEEAEQFVKDTCARINKLPSVFGGEVELVVAPTGFGFMNFIVKEHGWIMAKTSKEESIKNILEIGYKQHLAVMALTEHGIATCWISGTYQKNKSIEFCGGDCDVPAVVAYGGDDQDRWLDRVVKWFGSWRGKNEFEDKFYDKKESKFIKESEAGDRLDICSALASIPCANKPHAHRVVFDEPNIHFFAYEKGIAYGNAGWFDMGIAVAQAEVYYQAVGKKTKISTLEQAPESPFPDTKYYATLTLE